jgi:hypothetical protein
MFGAAWQGRAQSGRARLGWVWRGWAWCGRARVKGRLRPPPSVSPFQYQLAMLGSDVLARASLPGRKPGWT